jgi:hypothetical protein
MEAGTPSVDGTEKTVSVTLVCPIREQRLCYFAQLMEVVTPSVLLRSIDENGNTLSVTVLNVWNSFGKHRFILPSINKLSFAFKLYSFCHLTYKF